MGLNSKVGHDIAGITYNSDDDAKAAQLDNFIDDLPEGWDTLGRRQRAESLRGERTPPPAC
jgi:hypothetical protein